MKQIRSHKNPWAPKGPQIKLVQKGPQKAIFPEKSEEKFWKILEHCEKTVQIKHFCLIAS